MKLAVVNVEILTKEFKGDEAKARRVFREICAMGNFGMLHFYATIGVSQCNERVQADIEQLIAAEKETPRESTPTPPVVAGYGPPPDAVESKPTEAKSKGRGRPKKKKG